MPLPDRIAIPGFHALYRLFQIFRGKKFKLIQRTLHPVDEKQRLAFDHLFDSALQSGPNTLIDYHLPYPKSDFLNYLCDQRGYVAHGSILPDLATLEPIRKSKDFFEFGNRQQIFASPDALWAMWFAILNKDRISLTNNGCIRTGSGARRVKYYFFGLPHNTQADLPFTDGTVYITKAEDFPDKRLIPLLYHLNAEIEEWGSTTPVIPLARLPVAPTDFPYLDQVQFAK